MSKSSSSPGGELQSQLRNYKSIVERHRYQLREDSLLHKQLDFWLESARFLITELEIWEEMANPTKRDETIAKARKAPERVHDLLFN